MDCPVGLRYIPDFLTKDEHDQLLEDVRRLEFGPVKFRGNEARRRVVCFGFDYVYKARSLKPATRMPDWLGLLAERVERAAGVECGGLAQTIVTHYPVGAGIGWHTDAKKPFGEVVASVSLAGECKFQFRRGTERATVTVHPGSLLLLTGESRWDWEHTISPVRQTRYSITLRQLASGVLRPV